MYSYFKRSSIHRQSAVSSNVPDWKKWCLQLMDPPPLCIPMFSSNVKPMQILPMLRHGGNIKIWCDIGRFFVSWGYAKVSPNNTYMGTEKNHDNHEHRSKKRWIHRFLLPGTHLNHPISSPDTPKSRECGRATSTRSKIFFSSKIVPETKYSEFNLFGGTTARRRPFLPHISRDPHMYLPRASPTCGYKMAHQQWWAD